MGLRMRLVHRSEFIKIEHIKDQETFDHRFIDHDRRRKISVIWDFCRGSSPERCTQRPFLHARRLNWPVNIRPLGGEYFAQCSKVLFGLDSSGQGKQSVWGSIFYQAVVWTLVVGLSVTNTDANWTVSVPVKYRKCENRLSTFQDTLCPITLE